MAALHRYAILDTPPEPDFDDIARLLADSFEAPIAIVNLVASDRQWFKAEIGLGLRETSLDVSICAHALLRQGVMVVPDTRDDPRFASNPLVAAEGGLRFYAGAVLSTVAGLPIGTLCVLDRKPRPEGITPRQHFLLEVLARQVMSQLELRRAITRRDMRTEALRAETREREQAEAALKESQRRYQSLFDSIDAGFCVIQLEYDADGTAHDYRFLETNPAFAEQTGLHDAIGHPLRELAPDTARYWIDVFGGAPSTGLTIRLEEPTPTADGNWYEIHAFRIGAPEDRQVAVLSNQITARRRSELALRELNATLDARVTEAMAAREAAHEALRQSQKLEAIGQLTGGVAHDFNNLLTVIRGSVDLLRRPDLPPDKRMRYIDAIGDTADRAAKVTGQLLAFARRQALTPILFDVGRSLSETADMLGTLSGACIETEARVPDEAFHILADRAQFDTAIINIGINARDAMKGEGRLVIVAEAVTEIPARRAHGPVAGDFIAVSITDTGPGIAEADIDRIFEPFFTTKGVGEGTGLGLSQVIGFAKQSGGDVRVESVASQGTTFTLYLPRAARPTDGVSEPDGLDTTPVDGDGACVLVVEDNEQVGAFATQALRELGYDSVMAPDASHAMAELAKDSTRFHIVFSDVVMPGMNGLELGTEIRRRYPDLPVILASGYSHVLARHGQQGFELLHKPYSVDQLSRVLHKAIGGRARKPIDIP
ncbi:response regulator [Sphingomonas solaris]|uniref:histidine kinase n=2 Tax=Alterirhizorhabdus solaris TaxID=2529389 RepID=A0A558R734_9SPHN|nr:response regulator [Sphingomonas solaris]